jgi:hypothetical protein
MVLYNCYCCNFSSKLKGDYNRHLKTKKHLRHPTTSVIPMVMSTNEHKMSTNEHKMSTNEHKMSTNDLKYSCDFCDDNFNTKANKRRHELHYCKENKTIKKLLNEKNKQIKKLEKTVDKLIDKTGNTTINHIQSTQQLNQQNNIKINNYGDEDLSHITDFFKTQLIKGPYGAIPKMIKAIHFNSDKPENNNIKYPNINKNYVKIMQNNKWVVKNKQDILKDMIDSKYLILDEHYNLILNGENISNNVKKNYINFSEKYDEGNNNLLNELIDDCELMILNNRN